MNTSPGDGVSWARRFVLAPTVVVADGVLFPSGLMVMQSRRSPGFEVYPGGMDLLPEIVRRDVAWIDELPSSGS